MAHLIDKDALVAEIEKRINDITREYQKNEPQFFLLGKIKGLENSISLLDTLEVKEVDLELNSFDATVCKICNTYLKEMDKDAIVKALEPYKDGDKVKVIIKHRK